MSKEEGKNEELKNILDGKIQVQKELLIEQLISNCAKEKLLEKGYTMPDIMKNNIEKEDLENSIASCCVGDICIPEMKVIKHLTLTQEVQDTIKEVIEAEATIDILPVEEEWEEPLVIERGFSICMDDKGKYKVSKICEGTPEEVSLEGCRADCREKGYEVRGEFHVHPNNVLIPSEGDLREAKKYNENVLYIGGKLFGKPTVNIFFKKDQYRWKDIFKDKGMSFVGHLPMITLRITAQSSNYMKTFTPIREYEVWMPGLMDDYEAKLIWKEEEGEKIENLSHEEIEKLWEDEKDDFYSMIEIEHHKQEVKFYKDSDLIKINKNGKEIFKKYFTVVTLEL